MLLGGGGFVFSSVFRCRSSANMDAFPEKLLVGSSRMNNSRPEPQRRWDAVLPIADLAEASNKPLKLE